MTSKMAEVAGCGLWNHMGFVMIHCTEKITFFVMVLFFVCVSVFWKSYPSIHALISRPLLAGSDNMNLNILFS